MSEWKLRVSAMKPLLLLWLMQVGIFLMNSMNLTWGLVWGRSRCFWMTTRRCHLMLWPTWQVFMGGAFATVHLHVHLPVPLLSSLFIDSLIHSSSKLWALTKTINMLDIIFRKRKKRKEHWPVWLSLLSIILQNERSPVWFQVRAHAWVVGLVLC